MKNFYEPASPLGLNDLLAFETFFNNLYSKNPASDVRNAAGLINKPYFNSIQHDTLNKRITCNEVELVIKGLKNGKSSSTDQVPNELIKLLPSAGITALTNLFNLCLTEGRYPWNTSIIVPLHKSGNKHNPDNYRAIGIGSCLGKTFSTVLLNRLLQFRAMFCPDPPNQLGFCKEAQTNDHILSLKTIIDKYYKHAKGKARRLFVCFVDFKKAFDNVSRDLLLYKLSNLGIQANFFRTIEDMYNKSTAHIKIGKLLTKAINICKGTEQGHPMSPDLFKIFILDLSEKFSKIGQYPELDDYIVNHLFWADDLVLFGLDNGSLQKNLDVLQSFCESWDLEVNYKKTKVICFGQKTTQDFIFASKPIKFTDNYTYLGITITKNGHVACARNNLRKKALRAVFSLRKQVNREHISPKSLLYLFDALIKPILLYGSQVIFPHIRLFEKLTRSDSEKLPPKDYFKAISQDAHELMYIKHLKWVLGVHKKASNVGVYGETGKLPINFDAIKMSCDYFSRCREQPDDKLVKKAFLEQKKLNLDWYRNMTECLRKLSFGTSNRDSINVFQNLRLQFSNTWQEYLNASPKLEYYKTVKNTFRCEDYLKIPVFKYRSALTRIRISAHNLEIERGRYAKNNKLPPTAREDRLCRYCHEVLQNKITESETHALNDCPLYIKHRSKFLKNASIQNLYRDNETPNVTHICEKLFSSDCTFLDTTSKSNLEFYLSKYCHQILDHRTAFYDFLDNYSE